MNIRKICFFILMISTIGNSKASQEDKDKEEEKDLTLCRALWQNKLNTFKKTDIWCYSFEENYIHHIEIADLKRFFLRKPLSILRKPLSKGEKLSFSKTDCLRFFAYSPGCFPEVISDLNYDIDMDDEEFEKIKEKYGLKEGVNDLLLKRFWNNAIKKIEMRRKNAQLIREFLEKNAEPDEEREKILQVMSKEVDENWQRLRSAVLKKNPDKREVIKLLESPRSFSQLPKLVAFKHVV